jgi:hypothetical protein
MIADEVAQRLHDRATRGQPLSAEERASLEAWYARQDAEEMAQLAEAPLPEDVIALRDQIQTLLAENEKLRKELAALRRQPAGEEDVDIRQAYPLMDEIARKEGWDDPEMDSYNVYARKPPPGASNAAMLSLLIGHSPVAAGGSPGRPS